MREELDRLKALPIAGNAHSDLPTMVAAGEIMDSAQATKEEKLEAMQLIDRIQGEPLSDMQDLEDYLAGSPGPRKRD